jgi:hypothetical protein
MGCAERAKGPCISRFQVIHIHGLGMGGQPGQGSTWCAKITISTGAGRTRVLKEPRNCDILKSFGYQHKLLVKKGKAVISMADKKTLGIVLIVVGIVVLLLAVLANPLGIGNPARFGFIQIAGVVVGAIVALVGLYLALKR